MFRSIKSNFSCFILFILLFTLFSPVFISAQIKSPSNGIGTDPVPYGLDEFSSGLQDIRRFEQIFFGAFPLAIFFAQLLGGLGLFVEHASYFPLGDESSPKFEFGVENYKTDDKIRIIVAGLGISFGVAIADMIIYQSRKKEEESRYKRRRLINMMAEEEETTGGDITLDSDS